MTTLELLEQGLARVKTGWTAGQLTKITNGVIRVCALGGLIPQDDYLRDPDALLRDDTVYSCLRVGTRCSAVEELSLAIQRVCPNTFWDEEKFRENYTKMSDFRENYTKMSDEGNEQFPMAHIDTDAHRGRVVNFNDRVHVTATTQAEVIAVYEDAIRAVKAAQPAEVRVRETDLATSGD